MSERPASGHAVLAAIDAQVEHLHRTRATFPHVSMAMLGATTAETAPYYRNKGFDVRFVFARALERADIEGINAVGHWINQNFVVRLFATLQSYGVVRYKHPIRDGLPGAIEVKILKALRNVFAHSTGEYEPTRLGHRKLHAQVIAHFKLVDEHLGTEAWFPIPIDEVLVPLAERSKEYAAAVLTGTAYAEENQEHKSRPRANGKK